MNLKPFCLMSLFMLIFASVFSFDESSVPNPSEPDAPEVKFPDMPSAKISNQENPQMLILLRVSLTISEETEMKGTAYFSNYSRWTVTNQILNKINIFSFSIYDIQKIDILKWKSEKKDENTYFFIPSEYKIYANNRDYFIHKGNIEAFNSLILSDDTSKKRYYSVFYDNWIEGKKGFYRWENSKASSFTYNFENPIAGVVKTIQFIK
jgi:hypothetical protein